MKYWLMAVGVLAGFFSAAVGAESFQCKTRQAMGGKLELRLEIDPKKGLALVEARDDRGAEGLQCRLIKNTSSEAKLDCQDLPKGTISQKSYPFQLELNKNKHSALLQSDFSSNEIALDCHLR